MTETTIQPSLPFAAMQILWYFDDPNYLKSGARVNRNDNKRKLLFRTPNCSFYSGNTDFVIITSIDLVDTVDLTSVAVKRCLLCFNQNVNRSLTNTATNHARSAYIGALTEEMKIVLELLRFNEFTCGIRLLTWPTLISTYVTMEPTPFVG